MHTTPATHHATADETALPPLTAVRQHWDCTPLPDVAAAVWAQLEASGLRARVAMTAGARVAMTAGSRGICNRVEILRACAEWLRAAGAAPFIVPAMGSHGGATAEGQTALLARLGITEASIGCPICATMDVVELGRLGDADATPVYLNRLAAEADGGILVVNRIKPHTSFTAPIESGLAKMCAVGLGNREGAAMLHRRGVAGLRDNLVPMARMVVERGRVLAGLAILENACEQTADIVGVAAEGIGAAPEAALLARVRHMVPRLPFEQIDVLVVDEIGKDISGTGMDTSVIGRVRIPTEPDPLSPRISIIVALSLTDSSMGSGVGVGLADLIPQRLADRIDTAVTYTNSLTSGLIGVQRAAIPITLPTPRAAVAAAIRVCGQPNPAAVRLVRIRSTLHLENLAVTAALLPEIAARSDLEVLGTRDWEPL